ncbi:MAG: hypothetical protein WBB28_01655 [Crinalium sp.]
MTPLEAVALTILTLLTGATSFLFLKAKYQELQTQIREKQARKAAEEAANWAEYAASSKEVRQSIAVLEDALKEATLAVDAAKAGYFPMIIISEVKSRLVEVNKQSTSLLSRFESKIPSNVAGKPNNNGFGSSKPQQAQPQQQSQLTPGKIVNQAATSCGLSFHDFLSAIASLDASLNSKEAFAALPESKRNAVIKKVKNATTTTVATTTTI